MEGTSKELDIFKANHGTTIMYHDESDPVFSMCNTVKYYDNLTSKYGAATASFARLFLLPGMNHCQYGSHRLDSWGSTHAIVNWKKKAWPGFHDCRRIPEQRGRAGQQNAPAMSMSAVCSVRGRGK